MARSGTAVVLVDQHLEIALPMADRTLLMSRGEIEFAGTAAELKEHLASG